MAEPKPAKDTIYIDAEDDITTVIDKVEAAQNKVVALVLPKRASSLQSIVNMRLLKRSSTSAKKNVVLITSEASLMPLAGAAGLHVAKNLHTAPAIPPGPELDSETPPAPADPDEIINDKSAKLDYHRSIGELADASAEEESEAIPLEDEDKPEDAPKPEKAKKDKKLSVPNFDRFRKSLLFGGLALLALIIFMVFATKLLPKSTITLKTTSLPVSANFDLVASSEFDQLNEDKGQIPAELKKSNQSENSEVRATGQKNLGKKASGSVTMTAQDCSPPFNTPADVPAGTGLSNSGHTYVTQAATSFEISGASGSCVNYDSSSSTAITAQQAGSEYNVSDETFAVYGRSEVSASGSASGGTDKTVTVLSQQDVNKAKDKVSSSVSQDFQKDFIKDLEAEGYYVIQDTIKSSEPQIAASPGVGEETSTSTITVKITHSALVIKKNDLKQAISKALEKELDKAKQKISSQDVVADANINVQSQPSPTKVVLSVSENTTAIPIIDTEAVKKQVGGKKSGEIRSELSKIEGVTSVEVKMSPFWVSKAPKKPSKISLVLVQEKTENADKNDSSGNSSP